MKLLIGLVSIVAGFVLCIPLVFHRVLDSAVNARIRARLPKDGVRQKFVLGLFVVGFWAIGILYVL